MPCQSHCVFEWGCGNGVGLAWLIPMPSMHSMMQTPKTFEEMAQMVMRWLCSLSSSKLATAMEMIVQKCATQTFGLSKGSARAGLVICCAC